jgi:hypothetical protein
LPVATASLGGIVAFYCLIYGPEAALPGVLAEWWRALRPGALVVVAVHAGSGVIRSEEFLGEPAGEITVELRRPEDLVARFWRAGFAVERRTVRQPYEGEHPTERCYVVARRLGR